MLVIFVHVFTGVHLDPEDGEWAKEETNKFRDLFEAREYAFVAQNRLDHLHTIVIKSDDGEPVEKWVRVGERWMRTDGSHAELHDLST